MLLAAGVVISAALAPPLAVARPPALSAPLLSRAPAFARAAPRCSAASVTTPVAQWCVDSGRPEAAVAVSGATTVAGALRDFWQVVGYLGTAPDAPRQQVVAFPDCEGFADVSYFQAVLNHVQVCSEACSHLGDSIHCTGRHPATGAGDEGAQAPYATLVLRVFGGAGALSDFEAEYGYPDPFADDAEDDGYYAQYLGGEDAGVDPAEVADGELLAQTRAWVEAVICHMKVCPFSATADVAGIPVGGVTYPITRATSAEGVYEQFWGQVVALEQTDEKQVATVLLITPEFAFHSPGGFDAFADTLNSALSKLDFEAAIQLVFFHPEYVFRDGQSRVGEAEGAAANFARRSPFPMINLLRTPQVRAAQKGVPTGSVYTTNERNLATVGVGELQTMLDDRDWTKIFAKAFAAHSENTWK